MKLKSLSLSLALTIASPVSAAMSDTQLSQALRQDINKHFVTFKAPKLIFHWVDASDINPPGQYNSAFPADAAHYKTYVDKQGSKIYRPRNSKDYDIEGPGLYMATDPFVSRSYGGKKTYGLIVGVVKPGARILANAYSNLNISPNLVKEIQGRGCQVSMYPQLLDTYSDPSCDKVKQLLVGADISFAEGRFYSFGTNEIEGCRSRFGAKDLTIPPANVKTFESLDTFVVYSSRMMSQVLGFTHKTTPGNNALANQILSYFKGLHAEGLISGYSTYPLLSQEQLSNSAIKAMGRADIAKFSQAHILGSNK